MSSIRHYGHETNMIVVAVDLLRLLNVEKTHAAAIRDGNEVEDANPHPDPLIPTRNINESLSPPPTRTGTTRIYTCSYDIYADDKCH